jgi:hypothetical protein
MSGSKFPPRKSVVRLGKQRSSNSSGSTTRFGLHGKFIATQAAGSFIDQISPVLLGAPLSTIAEEFLFWKFHKLRLRVIRIDLDATLAETPKMFALGVFQASNAIGTPTITTCENNPRNVQYARASHIAPEVAPTFTQFYEWLDPDLAIGPLGGWFRTVSGSDDEDGDSAGILYIVSDVTTNNTSAFQVEFEVDVEFKEIVENTITPASGSIALRYPGYSSLRGCSRPRVIDLADPNQHPLLSRINWPLQRVPPRFHSAVVSSSSMEDDVVVLGLIQSDPPRQLHHPLSEARFTSASTSTHSIRRSPFVARVPKGPT